MSSYAANTAPDLDPEYKRYFEKFYEISDNAPPDGTAEEYANEFTEDATVNMAGVANNGRDGQCSFYSVV